MKELPYIRVSYCMFGFPYRKTTRLWGTIKGFGDRVCNRKCGMIVDGKHKQNLGNAGWIRRDQRNSYPQPLKCAHSWSFAGQFVVVGVLFVLSL